MPYSKPWKMFQMCCSLLSLWSQDWHSIKEIVGNRKASLAKLNFVDDMDLPVLPLHHHPEYMVQCCKLINSEWKRSDTARLRSLEASCDNLPTCLILLDAKKIVVIGHCKLSPIPSKKEACFVESVVIDKALRGKGYGKYLMINAEEYCKHKLKLNMIYLSTKGQEGFYSKLGYVVCPPINIFGGYTSNNTTMAKCDNNKGIQSGPVPPPLPKFNSTNGVQMKTFMNKSLN